MQHDLLGSAINVSAINVPRVSSYHSFKPNAASSIIKKYLSGIHLSAERHSQVEHGRKSGELILPSFPVKTLLGSLCS